MRHRYGLACVFLLNLVLGCSTSATSPTSERTSSARSASVIAPNRTDVLVYENPSGAEDLPFTVPVVVSSTAAGPSVVFRIACGSNYGRILEGFGYPRDLDLDSADHFGSLEALLDTLRARTADAGDIPVRTLTCPANPSALRSQLTQVYRVLDPDPSKGDSNYYVRLREEPGAIYTLGCSNFLRALAWDEKSTVPINRAVLETWSGLGVATREINCYDAAGTPMPPVDRILPIVAPVKPASDQARLFRVRYAFEGIAAPMPLYLISDGKGYALDCGANQRAIKAAFGFPQTENVAELSTSDPLFIDSDPGKQPNLRCSNPGATIFEAIDENPASRYFRFAGSNSLFEFTCDHTRDYFAADVSTVRKIPRASVDYLFPDFNAPDARTTIHRLGCRVADDTAPRKGAFATVSVRRVTADRAVAVFDDGFELGGRVCATSGPSRVCLVGGLGP